MAEASYKIKRILWPPWAEGERSVGHVGILCQDINGPCPLLAILNVLLLRGSISLPSDAGEITEDRAVQILAEYLLDINASRQSQSDATDEYRANLEANVSDAIATLPKLTTGVDINVRFNGVRNVEFTQETAVFDILDVPLVHGWLVDPQDPAAVVLGTRSYNDVVMRIIATLGESGTPKVTSRRSIEPFRSSSMRGSSSRSRQGALYETGTTNITCESSGIRQRITGEMLNEALKASMSAAGAIDRRNETLESGSGAMMKTPETAKNASLKEDGMDSAINTMLSQVVKEAFKTPEGLITSKGTEKIERGVERGEDGEEERGSMKTDQRKLCGLNDSSSRKSIDDASTRRTILNDGLNPIDDSCCGQISKSPGEGASKFEQQDNLVGDSTSGATTDQEPRGLSSGKIVSRGDEHSGSSRLLRDVAMSTGISPNKDTGEGAAMQCDTAHVSLQAKTKDELSEVTREALLMREFLDANISQLTFHGLASLLEDVPDRSLSVFFRNNHFNALLRYDNALFILVTDQGYLYEPDVVWEYLCDVGGDTQLVGWNLKPFRPHAGNATESLETAELVNEASGNNKEFEDHAYSDFALAMQLQQEEQERARLADEREPHPTAAANRARERQEEQASFSQMIADRHEPSLSSRRVEGEQRGSEETQQHRDKFWRRRRSSSSEAEGESGRKQDSSCDIM